MKAAITDGRGRLSVKDIDMPVLETPYDALCEILYCATCVGTDAHIIDGQFHVPIVYPTILGHESVARVLRVGSAVRGFRPGDLLTRVGCPASREYRAHWGGFSEYGIARDHAAMRLDGLPARMWSAYRVNMRIPEGLMPPALATMIVTWRETLSYVTRMGIRKGASVLISGSGANGLSLGCMARLLGAARVVLVGSASRMDAARSMGFTQCVPYDDPAAIEEFRAANAGAFDDVIDAIGKQSAIAPLLGCLRRNGVFGCYGRDDYARYGLNPFLVGASFNIYGDGYDEYEAHDAVLDMIRGGQLDARLWLNAQFPLARIEDAYAHVRARAALKAVISIKQEGKA